MAQSWRVEPEPKKKPRPPLGSEALERLALHYVGRYATSRAKLKLYLARKVKERGWDGERAPDFDRLAQRLSELGYIDDGAFAAAKASSLQRRGYGGRRVEQALRVAGIEEADAAPVRLEVEEGALEAAMRFARRKRIGPFAAGEPDRDQRQKAFAAMMRAGHSFDVVREVLNASPADIPDSDKV
jgi:regulatory protein